MLAAAQDVMCGKQILTLSVSVNGKIQAELIILMGGVDVFCSLYITELLVTQGLKTCDLFIVGF